MESGTVKWFNASKGFGFIEPDGGGADVFVHISAVEQAGLSGLNDGDRVEFELERDRRSGKSSAGQLRVTAHGEGRPQRAPSHGGDRGDRGERRPSFAPQVSGSGSGTVKWFNATKGFGFIQPDDGGADVFVHISAVERAGLRQLAEGQTVTYELGQDRRTGKTSAENLRVTGQGAPISRPAGGGERRERERW